MHHLISTYDKLINKDLLTVGNSIKISANMFPTVTAITRLFQRILIKRKIVFVFLCTLNDLQS